MKGTVFTSLRTLVSERYGAPQWSAALETAGVESAIFLPLETYPDDTFARIAAAVSISQGEPLDDLLFALGRHLAGQLRRSHPTMFRVDRRARDLIEQLGPGPPRSGRGYLDLLPLTIDADPSETMARFSGTPPLCMLAKGVVNGLARECNERAAVLETQCQKRGAPVCLLRLVFTRASETPSITSTTTSRAATRAATDGEPEVTVLKTKTGPQKPFGQS